MNRLDMVNAIVSLLKHDVQLGIKHGCRIYENISRLPIPQQERILLGHERRLSAQLNEVTLGPIILSEEETQFVLAELAQHVYADELDKTQKR